MLAKFCRWTLPSLILICLVILFRLGFAPAAATAFQADQLTLAARPVDEPTAQPPAPTPTMPRRMPWRIRPEHDEPRMVTDQQLRELLARVEPPAEVNTNTWVHALRLWGPRVRFDDPRVPDGPTLLNYFLDDATFRRFAGPEAPPLFEIQSDGTLAVRSFDDDYTFRTSSSYHQNDLLATMAECGQSLDTPIVTRQGTATVGDLLTAAMNDFHLDQHEYEWSAISYARYAHPHAWSNRYGQPMDAGRIVDELLVHPLSLGPCNGLHRLEAVVVLYRADEQAGALSPRTRARMLARMQAVGRLLAASQSSAGSWDRQWPKGPAAQHQGVSLDEQILVTGHHLEWLALAPEEVLPPRENLVRAGQWLARTMLEVDDKHLESRYGPFSHAARALCLWRGGEAGEFRMRWNASDN